MRGGGWGPVAAELSNYFLTAESANGLSSSWAPLVGIAQGGAVTSADRERRIVDGRFGFATQRSSVGQHREVRAALLRLPVTDPSGVTVLWAAYGSTPWERMLDEGLGAGVSAKLADHLDARLFGVALLTPEFLAGVRGWAGPVPLTPSDRRGNHVAWRAPGAWLVDLALTAKSRGKHASEGRRAHATATLSEVGRSAVRLLRQAENDYSAARRSVPSPVVVEPKQRRERKLGELSQLEFSVGGRR